MSTAFDPLVNWRVGKPAISTFAKATVDRSAFAQQLRRGEQRAGKPAPRLLEPQFDPLVCPAQHGVRIIRATIASGSGRMFSHSLAEATE